MNITREDVDALNAVVRIQLEPSDYSDRVDEILKQHRQKATMSGFRPGKVPMGLIRKMYRKPVLAEEINKIVNEALFKYLEENKVEVLGNPMPSENSPMLDLEADNFELAFDLGLAPEFEVKVSDKDKLTYYKIVPDDELISKQVNDIAKRHGKVASVDVTDESSMVYGDFNELNEEGEIKEGGIYNSNSLFVEFVADDEVKQSLVGLKAEDTVDVDPHTVSRDAKDLATMLGIDESQAASISSKFRFTVKNISSMDPHPLDEELFKLVAGEEVTTEEDFRAWVAADLATALARNSDARLENDLVEHLLDKHAIELPDAFLKRWIEATNENQATAEDIEKDYPNYAKALRWQLIENRLIDKYELKAEFDDLVAYTKELLKQNLAQYGQTEPDEEYLDSSARNILQNRDEARKITERMYGERVISALRDTVKLKEKEVSYDEFVNLASGKPAKNNLLSSLIGS